MSGSGSLARWLGGKVARWLVAASSLLLRCFFAARRLREQLAAYLCPFRAVTDSDRWWANLKGWALCIVLVQLVPAGICVIWVCRSHVVGTKIRCDRCRVRRFGSTWLDQLAKLLI